MVTKIAPLARRPDSPLVVTAERCA